MGCSVAVAESCRSAPSSRREGDSPIAARRLRRVRRAEAFPVHSARRLENNGLHGRAK